MSIFEGLYLLIKESSHFTQFAIEKDISLEDGCPLFQHNIDFLVKVFHPLKLSLPNTGVLSRKMFPHRCPHLNESANMYAEIAQGLCTCCYNHNERSLQVLRLSKVTKFLKYLTEVLEFKKKVISPDSRSFLTYR